jgi:hypothetical protein
MLTRFTDRLLLLNSCSGQHVAVSLQQQQRLMRSGDCKKSKLCASLQPLGIARVVLHPTQDTQVFVIHAFPERLETREGSGKDGRERTNDFTSHQKCEAASAKRADLKLHRPCSS